MSKLEELIEQYCPDGVEWKPLGECCNILDGKRKPITKGARQSGPYPYYGANGIQDWVADYIFDGTYVLIGEDGSVITPNGTPIVNWAHGKIWVNNHAHIIAETTGVLLRFLFYYIQIIDIHNLVHGNIPKLTQGDLKDLEIPVPPLPVQEEIVRILDNFTELQAELQKRLQQYNYYLDNLLSFNREGQTEVKWMKMSDIAKLSRGHVISKDYLQNNAGIYPVYSSQTANNGELWQINTYDYNGNYLTWTTDGAYAGTIFKRKGCFSITNVCGLIALTSELVNLDYLYYWLKITAPSYVYKGMGNPKLMSNVMESILIPIIPLSEQQRIVSILDRFDTLTNDLTAGLPAEIEKRRQQYEYYRDKLLTFKRKEA